MEGGRIIFISSTAHFTGVPLNTHGVVAKAGVDALSAQLAIELGPRGLTSNVVTPGPYRRNGRSKKIDREREYGKNCEKHSEWKTG